MNLDHHLNILKLGIGTAGVAGIETIDYVMAQALPDGEIIKAAPN